MPRKLFTSVLVSGGLIAVMAAILSGSAFTPSALYTLPKNFFLFHNQFFGSLDRGLLALFFPLHYGVSYGDVDLHSHGMLCHLRYQ